MRRGIVRSDAGKKPKSKYRAASSGQFISRSTARRAAAMAERPENEPPAKKRSRADNRELAKGARELVVKLREDQKSLPDGI